MKLGIFILIMTSLVIAKPLKWFHAGRDISFVHSMITEYITVAVAQETANSDASETTPSHGRWGDWHPHHQGRPTLASPTTLSLSASATATQASSSTESESSNTQTSAPSSSFRSTSPAASSSSSSTSAESQEPSTTSSSSTASSSESTSTSSPSTTTTAGTKQALPEYAQRILDQHNLHRQNSSVSALTWSNQMASIAQEIANSCVYKHNMTVGDVRYGQNIGAGAMPSQVPAMITNGMYNGEVELYPGYGVEPDMTNFEAWGHYSQIVWKATQEVGCATKQCDSLEGVSSEIAPYYTVCNYFPEGNMSPLYADNVMRPGNMASVTASNY